jgi:probable addiction module antidote protein
MKNENVKLYKWDIQDHLKTDEDILGYLEAALEEDDIELILHVLCDIAKAKGMSKVAK